MNIPIFILALRVLRSEFVFYSLLGTLALVLFQPLTAPYITRPELDIFLAAIFSGVVGGLGSGIVIRAGASTAGSTSCRSSPKKK